MMDIRPRMRYPALRGRRRLSVTTLPSGKRWTGQSQARDLSLIAEATLTNTPTIFADPIPTRAQLRDVGRALARPGGLKPALHVHNSIGEMSLSSRGTCRNFHASRDFPRPHR